MTSASNTRMSSVPRYALVAVAAAIGTIALKGAGYFVTGSIAVLSDALESIVNVVTSLAAFVLVTIAARPADEEHAYGHTKVEYFASGFEGAMILVAAVTIGYAALRRLIDPVELAGIPEGFAFVSAATLLNFLTSRLLIGAGKRHRSIALEAGGQHLMVDVWTSLVVLGGLAASRLTGWVWLDPLLALGVAINILRIGYDLVRRSMLGLLDTALPEELRAEIARILEQHRPAGVQYHAVRTRQAGSWRFISFHILVPGDWTVQRGHDLLEEIEEKVRSAIPDSTVFTHLEPIEDPLSWQDTGLRR